MVAPSAPASRMAAKASTRARTEGRADRGRGSSGATGRHRTLPGVRVLVVLPTYQEAENIVDVLRRVRGALPEADVLVVDDGSPDGTADLAEGAGTDIGGVEVLRRDQKSGLGSAYRAGFRIGIDRGFDVLVEMDSDLSHDPAALPALVAPLEDGRADLAIGSRYVEGGEIPAWSRRRRALSRWGNRYAAWVLGLRVADATSGFRAYRAPVVERLGLDTMTAEGYAFQIEMAYRVARVGGRIVEVPIRFVDRTLGHSKMSGRIVVEALVRVTWWSLRDRRQRRRQWRARG
jgi:dolichol-phosphate mannosyltransferase